MFFYTPSSTTVFTVLVALLVVLPLAADALQSVTSDNVVDDTDSAVVVPISSNNNSSSSSSITTDSYDCPDCPVTDTILFPWFVEFMGCVILFVLVRFNLPVPYAACLFIFGALMGAGASLRLAENALNHSILMWANIDSALLLLIFLPGLIFKDAVEINFNLFAVAIGQIWILSFPMVLLGTFLVAFAGMYIMPYDWALGASATLGAILSSTDPIAVASVLKTSGASPRLVMHIQGESLLNDGSAFVFFTIFSNMYYYDLGLPNVEPTSAVNAVALFFQMSLGGIAVGICFGIGLLGVIYELDRRLEREFDILQVVSGLSAAYLAYWVCDQILIMSGVVACVAVGMVVNAFGRGMINNEKSFGQYLALAEFLLNTLLFTLGGVIWGSISLENVESYRIRLYDWGWLMGLYILLLVFRFLQVGVFYPILSRIGLKSNPKEAIFLAYGGLRGAVGVALGLSLVRFVFDATESGTDDDFQARKSATILQFMGGGVTLLTLTINGSSAGFVLKKLGLAKPAISKERQKIVFEGAAKDFVYEQISQLIQEPRFECIDFMILKEHVPFVTKEPPRFNDDDPFEEEGRVSNGHRASRPSYSSHTTRQFHRRVASNGDQYMRVLNATERASEHLNKTMSERQLKQRLLIELRQVFLELLADAYNLQQELGELDVREDNGFMHDVLIHSVDLATNAVEHENDAIEDWKYTEMFGFLGKGVSESITSPDGSLSSSVVLRSSFLSSVNSESSNFDVAKQKKTIRRLRFEIIRAITFKEGHEMAETKLQLYVNRLEDSSDGVLQQLIQSALEQVLNESRAQVLKADEMLEDATSKVDMAVVMSHYCARIIIRRLITFTERKYEDGLVSKLEARKYLADLNDRVRAVVTRFMEKALRENDEVVQTTALTPVEEDLQEKDVEEAKEEEAPEQPTPHFDEPKNI